MNKILIVFIFLISLSINADFFEYFNKIGVINSAPNFIEIQDVDKRKKVFFEYLKPVIQEQNQKILQLRNKIKYNKLSNNFLLKIAQKYRTNVDNLLNNIDIIPVSLALTQAAIESNWGRSRFAQYNNYYGIWCFKQGCGLVPNNREVGATHEVATFTTIKKAVRYYMWTLNSHPAYQKLRRIRQQLRVNNLKISGTKLAEGLEKYSGVSHKYIKILQKMIKYNKLQ